MNVGSRRLKCPDCAAADIKPEHPSYRGGCDECSARLIARSHQAAQARADGRVTPGLRLALQGAFGERWVIMAKSVSKWQDRLRRNR